MISVPGQAFLGVVNVSLTAIIMACALVILAEAARRSYRVLGKGIYTRNGAVVHASDADFRPPDYGEA